MMEVGKQYLVIRPGDSFEDDTGELVIFDEIRKEIEILPKSDTVICFDGVDEWIEPMPEHLKQANWYWVKDLNKGIQHWLNDKFFSVTEL